MKDNNTTYGIPAIICSIIGVFMFGLIFEPIAIILGAIGVSKANNETDKALSIVGLVIGVIGSLICLVALGILAK